MQCLSNFLERIERFLTMGTLMIATTLAFFLVINRNIIHLEMMGMNDLIVYLYSSCLLIGMAYATKIENHSVVEVIPNKMKERGEKVYTTYLIVIDFISLSIVLTFMPQVYAMFVKAVKYPQYGTLITWFNQSWIIYIMFVSFCLCIVHLFLNIGIKFKRLSIVSKEDR
ncbi:MAG: hypothetical protein VB076_11565 [Synergistaceae bacterium]|nr:hypothetical protein [Synergistaceae bacterium]